VSGSGPLSSASGPHQCRLGDAGSTTHATGQVRRDILKGAMRTRPFFISHSDSGRLQRMWFVLECVILRIRRAGHAHKHKVKPIPTMLAAHAENIKGQSIGRLVRRKNWQEAKDERRDDDQMRD
jgi:hypothetical protein